MTSDNPPINVLLTNETMECNGDAVLVGGRRLVSVAVAKIIVPGLSFYTWRTEKEINESLTHELVHAVDFRNPEIMEAQADYDRRFDRPTELGRFAAALVGNSHRNHMSPMERHAYEVVERLQEQRRVPRIVRLVM